MSKIREQVLETLPSRIQNQVQIVLPEDLGQDYLLHISVDKNIREFRPSVSNRTLNSEDRSVPRIATTPHLDGALAAYQAHPLDFDDPEFDGLFKIYGLNFEAAVKPNARLLADVRQTDEHWLITYNRDTEQYKPFKMGEFALLSFTHLKRGERWRFELVLKVNSDNFPLNRQWVLEKGYYYLELESGWNNRGHEPHEIRQFESISQKDYRYYLDNDVLTQEQLMEHFPMSNGKDYSEEGLGPAPEKLRQRDFRNLVILSNGVQVSADVIEKIAGNEIADGFGGSELTRSELNRTLSAKLQHYIHNHSS